MIVKRFVHLTLSHVYCDDVVQGHAMNEEAFTMTETVWVFLINHSRTQRLSVLVSRTSRSKWMIRMIREHMLMSRFQACEPRPRCGKRGEGALIRPRAPTTLGVRDQTRLMTRPGTRTLYPRLAIKILSVTLLLRVFLHLLSYNSFPAIFSPRSFQPRSTLRRHQRGRAPDVSKPASLHRVSS
ncbi:hypothetical protein P153DRAFT_175549 [Dothidotthia symphoricarpi CBS 119687]|uniref:Uncharacterized protein n=1 Tax=Dothidotthia symphoricarpi CBS 119687 TaxID=1392245 RepID=A0A6A6AM49_9PLEO|nr:uncharacterized protein P153DRAFT_175549 [Dothidotthia symphoricarpi CBS 119687]KAF2132870.1 hypothetical protein P153DRAFT_175549 [Dothidotthia symphoricarpi CBS 119687]